MRHRVRHDLRGSARRSVRVAVRLVASGAGLALVGQPAAGQTFAPAPRAQPEIRAEFAAGAEPALLGGAGVNVPAGYYVRVGTWVAGGRVGGVARGDAARAAVQARFLADPFGEMRWGPYVGGGVAMDWRTDARPQASVLLLVGTELPGRRSWRPAVEVGVGGGLRASVAVRAARRTGR